MKKPAFWICEYKGTDQLCGNCAGDQRLSFHYIDSTISLLPKSGISSLLPSSAVVQPGLCRPGLKSKSQVFSHTAYDTC